MLNIWRDLAEFARSHNQGLAHTEHPNGRLMKKTEDKKSPQELDNSAKLIEITGIVIPVEWDDNANPIQFALSAYDEHEYIIDNFTTVCPFPQKILRKKIKVYGIMGKITKKRKKITITRYDVLEENFLGNSI